MNKRKIEEQSNEENKHSKGDNQSNSLNGFFFFALKSKNF